MRKVPKHLAKEIAALKRLKDKGIDLSDIPEIADFSRFVVGKFYRPIKKPVTIRLDADLIAWLRKQGPGYQTRVNHILREAMVGSVRRST
jgi:uncharacterized protein (DUF4415 family)